MNTFDVESYLTQRFADKMPGLCPDLPIDYTNAKVSPAISGAYKGMFIRFRVSFLSDSRFVATEGDIKHYRDFGSVIMQVIAPLGEGSGRLRQVSDKVSGIFISHRNGSLLSRTPSPGPVREDKTASVTVSVPFQSDYKVNKEGQRL